MTLQLKILQALLSKDGQGNVTKNKGVNKISVKEGQSPNIKLYNDMAAALSAVIGTRSINQLSGIPQSCVFDRE